MSCTIGITLGDVTGIGPEVTFKALSNVPLDDTRYVVIGDGDRVRRLGHELAPSIHFVPFDPANLDRFSYAESSVVPLGEDFSPGDRRAAQAAVDCLNMAGRLCLKGDLNAMVTAPVNKESIICLGNPFVGQTEFLSELAGTARTAMMLLGADDRNRWLRVALATTHVRLRDVAAELTRNKIELAINLAARACHDLGLARARVGVCGLNPHAGEGGKMGDEEITVIQPAVRAAQDCGVDVLGPFAADTLFYHAFHGAYDVVVAMYHDQGLVPLKMIGFETGVNWTLGLPFIRTSPDHGTAYDIAGKGIADPSSMIAAIDLARMLATKQIRREPSVQPDAHFAKVASIG
jgi:4-hydroxythreonine-4-phosphate dehydrogenase